MKKWSFHYQRLYPVFSLFNEWNRLLSVIWYVYLLYSITVNTVRPWALWLQTQRIILLPRQQRKVLVSWIWEILSLKHHYSTFELMGSELHNTNTNFIYPPIFSLYLEHYSQCSWNKTKPHKFHVLKQIMSKLFVFLENHSFFVRCSLIIPSRKFLEELEGRMHLTCSQKPQLQLWFDFDVVLVVCT